MGAMAGASVGNAAIDQPEMQKKAIESQQQAATQANDAATKAASQADQANNAANAKQPDIQGIQSSNQMAAKGGVSGTMLTGPQGVDPKSLLLGKATLLGS